MKKSAHQETAAGFTYIHCGESLSRLTSLLRGVSRVALDTEADSLHHYFEKVCLIQLTFSGTTYIVDPLAGIPPGEFLEELSRKELIIQGADYDLRMMKKTFDFRAAAPVFDTMLAAQVLGYEKIGLAPLVEKFCGITLPKTAQKSDWAKRPLSEKLLSYAANDTRYLEKVASGLTAELRGSGREHWHRECCERVVEAVGRPVKNSGNEREEWRIKGSAKLSPRTLVFVRELWKWRDTEARRRDRPPFMIMLNENLIKFAGWLAVNPEASAADGPSFLRKISGDNLARLEDAIRRARSCPPENWPQPLKPVFPREASAPSEKTEELRAACKKIADKLRIEPSFLISRAAATNIVRGGVSSIGSIMETGGLMRWQAEAVLPAVKAVLS
ncbi:MAG: Ribonuclease D [Candidatus Omnitrophica bacterium ADurb.Bin277]|nr:MAG: Ribonuclease D [Candidatus Omnitrophica bacterium ADurb.Bin277]